MDYHKNYYKKHRQEILEYNRRYYYENRERVREIQKRYYNSTYKKKAVFEISHGVVIKF